MRVVGPDKSWHSQDPGHRQNFISESRRPTTENQDWCVVRPEGFKEFCESSLRQEVACKCFIVAEVVFIPRYKPRRQLAVKIFAQLLAQAFLVSNRFSENEMDHGVGPTLSMWLSASTIFPAAERFF